MSRTDSLPTDRVQSSDAAQALSFFTSGAPEDRLGAGLALNSARGRRPGMTEAKSIELNAAFGNLLPTKKRFRRLRAGWAASCAAFAGGWKTAHRHHPREKSRWAAQTDYELTGCQPDRQGTAMTNKLRRRTAHSLAPFPP